MLVEDRPADAAAMAARYQQREQEKAAQSTQIGVPATDPAPPYQADGPSVPVVQHKNFVNKAYNALTLSIVLRWIVAMVALALSAVILSDGPATQLKIAAAYTIAAAAIHIPLIGFPKLKPRSPADASMPRWFLVSIAVTALSWIPSFALMFNCYVKGNNYADSGSDGDDDGYDSSDDGFWKRGIIFFGTGGYDSLTEPIDKLALATGIVGVIAFLWTIRLWFHQLALKRGVFHEDDIAEVYHGKRTGEQVVQV